VPTRPAFTVVEVLVALTVFSVAALGSAAAVGSAAREQLRATAQREALDIVRAQSARLTAMPCDSLFSGARTVRAVNVAWTVARDSLATITLIGTHRGTTTRLHVEVACD
jgi:prepilin-type N-terminal cleavage/methylation domain-containing protein